VIILRQMMTVALRDRQHQQAMADEMNQSSARSPEGSSSSSAVEMQIKRGIAHAEQLIHQDSRT